MPETTWIHVEARRALVHIGADAVEPLIDLVSCTKDHSACSGAIEALAEIRDPRSTYPLLSLLKVNSYPIHCERWSIVQALGKIGDVRSIEPLIDLFDQQIQIMDHDAVRMCKAIIESLALIGRSQALERLRLRLGNAINLPRDGREGKRVQELSSHFHTVLEDAKKNET
jgi:HEAT repeat protein